MKISAEELLKIRLQALEAAEKLGDEGPCPASLIFMIGYQMQMDKVNYLKYSKMMIEFLYLGYKIAEEDEKLLEVKTN